MPKKNPKWNKQRIQDQYKKKMGVSQDDDSKCMVDGCGKPKKRIISSNSVNDYVAQLGWKLNIPNKGRKVTLCKDHAKDYQKIKKKEEKYKQMRDYGE